MKVMAIKPDPELKISLDRGKTGKYGWEISYSGSDVYEVLNVVLDADRKLKKYFENGEKSKQDKRAEK